MSVINYKYLNGKTIAYQISTFKASSVNGITSEQLQKEADERLLNQIETEVGTDYKCSTGSGTSYGSTSSTSSASSAEDIVNPQSTDWHYLSSVGSAGSTSSVGGLEVSIIVDMYIKGNMTINEVLKGLTAHNIKYGVSGGTISFSYNGKDYNIYCNSEASKSQIDNITVGVYTEYDLKNKYKFNDKVIEQNFQIVEKIWNEKTNSYEIKYAILDEYTEFLGVKTAEDLKKAYDKYAQDLIRDNFLANANKNGDSQEYLLKFGNKQLSMENLLEYTDTCEADDILTGKELLNQKQSVLNKLIKDFTEGNLSASQISTILRSIGSGISKKEENNGILTITFKFLGKTYEISCNSVDAQKGTDKSDLVSFTKDEISKLGLLQNVIDGVFIASTTVDGKVEQYTLKPNYKLVDIKNFIREADFLIQNGISSGKERNIATNSKGFLIILKKEIMQKYNISEEYYDSISDFVSNNRFDTYEEIEKIVEKLCSAPQKEEFTYSEIVYKHGYFLNDFNYYDTGINTDNFGKRNNGKCIYMDYLRSLISKVSDKYYLNNEQEQAFLRRVLYKMSKDPDPIRYSDATVTPGMLEYYTNNNGTWLDKFTNVVNEEAEKLVGFSNTDTTNVSKIDLNELFKQLGSESIIGGIRDYKQLYDLTLSFDPGVRKFAQTLIEGIKNWSYITFENNSQLTEEEQYDRVFKAIIASINYQITGNMEINTVLSKVKLQKLAQSGNFFSKLNSILDESNVAILSLSTIDGEMDTQCGQNNIGDCWAISGLLAINSTHSGKNIIRSLITKCADGSVKVKFPGANKIYTITAREIANADVDVLGTTSQYSSGDNDLLVWELALEKLRLERGYGKSCNIGTVDSPLKSGDPDELFKYIFGHSAIAQASDGEYVWSALFGTDVIAMKESTVSNVLSDIWNKILSNCNGISDPSKYFYYANQAITFSLHTVTGDHDFSATDIYGNQFVFNIELDKFFDDDGHVFYVTNMTETTITFSNPWYSEITRKGSQHAEYTFTWEQFAQLGIAEIAYTDVSWYNNYDYYHSDQG